MSTETDVVVRCARLIKIYPSETGETHALRGVEAGFRSGTVTAVTGPSGSGKSSLLSVLALRERQSGGELWLLGQDVGQLPGRRLRELRRNRVAFVARRPTESLFAHLPMIEQLEHVARLRGAPPGVGVDLLARLDLGARAAASVKEISGGEQQRLSVAAAVIGSPALVIADEPTAELDDASAQLVLVALRDCAAAGSAVVFATHDARAIAAADRVLALRHGVLSTERAGTGVATAAIDSTGRLQLPPEALALLPGDRVLVVVRDGEIRLLPPTDPPGAA